MQSFCPTSKPFWIDEEHEFIRLLEQHQRIIRNNLLTNHHQYDVVIIGAGLSGVSSAYWLRKLYPIERFPRILILEKNIRPCSGATGRNGGFLWPADDYLADYVEEFGYENACQWIEFQHENIRAIAQVVDEHQIDCDLNLSRGNVALARTEDESRRLVQSYEFLRDYLTKDPEKKNFTLNDFELWDSKKCREMLHSNRFQNGLLMRQSGTIWAAKFVYGLLKYCLDQSGVDLLTESKVLRIEDSNKLILENGRVIIAEQAIIHATNAYAVEYLEFTREKIIPTRGQCSRSKPIEKIFWTFGLSSKEGEEYYHQSPLDGRIFIGGCRWRSVESEHNNQNDSQINLLIHQEHQQFFSQWYPGLTEMNHQIEIEQTWTGIMAFTIDRLPLIGPLPNNPKQFILAGYNGEGMPNAFLCGKAIARMIAHDDPYVEGIEKNTVSFLKIFLPERFDSLIVRN